MDAGYRADGEGVQVSSKSGDLWTIVGGVALGSIALASVWSDLDLSSSGIQMVMIGSLVLGSAFWAASAYFVDRRPRRKISGAFILGDVEFSVIAAQRLGPKLDATLTLLACSLLFLSMSIGLILRRLGGTVFHALPTVGANDGKSTLSDSVDEESE
jgi:hypothetical protein